jgi:hypothetical protein
MGFGSDLNRSPPKPHIKELLSRDNAVLTPRHLSYMGPFYGLGGHAPRLTGLGARVVRGSCRLANGRGTEGA